MKPPAARHALTAALAHRARVGTPAPSWPTRAMSSSALPRPYRFHVGASWAGKPKEPRSRRSNMAPFPKDSEIGRWRDHVLSRPNGGGSKHIGEDFFFIQEMRNQSTALQGIALGVADGVGGWTDSGVDPSLFSQALMYHAHRYAKLGWAGEREIDPTQEYEEREEVEGWELQPMECMDLAHHAVLRERLVTAGSSTACIVHMNASSGLLRAANLGDSGFCIIRSSSVIYFQQPQTHFFNCPKQLAKLPANQRILGGACQDPASDADVYETKLRDGDIVILFTDGLSDNVFPSELMSICSLVARQYTHAPPPVRKLDESGSRFSILNAVPTNSEGEPYEFVRDEDDAQVQTMAERIVSYACLCMKNRMRVSPFERAAAREGMYFRGGKLDDVTVVVAQIRETI